MNDNPMPIPVTVTDTNADPNIREGRIKRLVHQPIYRIHLETSGDITEQDVRNLLSVGMSLPDEHIGMVLRDGFAVSGASLDAVLKRLAQVFYVEKHTRVRFHVDHITAPEHSPAEGHQHVFLGSAAHEQQRQQMPMNGGGLGALLGALLGQGGADVQQVSLEELLNDIGGRTDEPMREPGDGRVFIDGEQVSLDALPDDMPDELKDIARQAVADGATMRFRSPNAEDDSMECDCNNCRAEKGLPPIDADGKPLVN